MHTYFCVSITFLDPVSAVHARRDGGIPEWPPSPLRMFQALVAAAASRWRGQQFELCARPALQWLQCELPPVVIAPTHLIGMPFRIAVPNNDMDSPASWWAKGQEPKKPHRPIDLKPLKTVRPIRLLVNENDPGTIHYLFSLADGSCPHLGALVLMARSVTHLGWGVDMVVGNGLIIHDDEAEKLPGERWRPAEDTLANRYRVPAEGTLDALLERHEAFLNRVGPDGFNPVPPLSTFRSIGYRRATEPSQRQFAAFSILTPDASAFQSFDATCRTRDVAGMLRHVVAAAACRNGWPAKQINIFVHGKSRDGQQPASGKTSPDRFAYIPLPTINHKLGRVESIRRVLLVAPAHCSEQIAWGRRALSGEDLQDNNGDAAGLLTILPGSDWVLRQYIGSFATWSTVTPVILPGHDDRDEEKGLKLLKAAFAQAGYNRELMANAEIEWRKVGFRAGLDLASRYLPPKNLDNRPRYHVRVRFPHLLPGPIVVGSGRFRGFGLFAGLNE